MVPCDFMSDVLASAGLLSKPHAEALPLRRRSHTKSLDRLPVLLLVKDGQKNRKVDDGAFVLGESSSEGLCHVAIGLVVAINNPDDVLDGILLLPKTL